MPDYSHLPKADSAGITFSGRTLGATPFSGDTGQTPANLRVALAAYTARTGAVGPADILTDAADLANVVSALAGARVFVPVVAVLGETETGVHGVKSDKNADMALVTVKGSDGRTALPVFTSVADLTNWNPASRPIPVEAERAALSAVSERCDVLVLNPASDAVVVPRSAMWALARGLAWVPAFDNPAVREAVRLAVNDEHAIVAHECSPGLGGAMRLNLGLIDGLSASEVQDLIARIQQRIGQSEAIADGVDGLEIKLTRAPLTELSEPNSPEAF